MNNFFIDPLDIARKEGVIVIPSSHLDVNGQIRKNPENNEVIIEYDVNMHPNRQRFTLAHELGHYFLGHLDDNNILFRDPAKNFSLDNYDPYEAEANKFAADLLMPKEKIDFLLQEVKMSSIEGMAKALQVSPAAMTYRLKNLGYIS